MLLNHKDALDFVLDVPDYLKELSVHRIEDIHSILTKELGVDRNIRHRRVGITGTNYRPLDNEFQIREALEDTCTLVNGKDNVFEKALLTLVLLSYIQAFVDGNKRTAFAACSVFLQINGHKIRADSDRLYAFVIRWLQLPPAGRFLTMLNDLRTITE